MGIYLDYNASTPIDPRVVDAMVEVYRNVIGNADSRTHDYGMSAHNVVEQAREHVAELLKVQKNEIVFTSGATESDNIAILGLRDYAKETNKKHIISTAIEHKAVLEPLALLEKQGFEVTYIKPGCDGRVSADEVLSNIRKDTLLVSVMHANNETGVIQPVYEIGEALADIDVLFHVDAAQTFGKCVEELQTIKYDILSASAHKMYGPQGIGALVLRRKHFKLPPVQAITHGGSQELGIRPGTLPTALIAGFGKACEIALYEYKSNSEKYMQAKVQIKELLDRSGVKYRINGPWELTLPSTMNVTFDQVNSEALMLASKQYCAISNGSACNSHSYKPSYVLASMGMPVDEIECSVRISWGTNHRDEEIMSLLAVVASFQ